MSQEAGGQDENNQTRSGVTQAKDEKGEVYFHYSRDPKNVSRPSTGDSESSAFLKKLEQSEQGGPKKADDGDLKKGNPKSMYGQGKRSKGWRNREKIDSGNEEAKGENETLIDEEEEKGEEGKEKETANEKEKTEGEEVKASEEAKEDADGTKGDVPALPHEKPTGVEKAKAEKGAREAKGEAKDDDEEGIDEEKQDFKVSEGLTSDEAKKLLEEYGRNELEEKNTPKWLIFLQLLYQPMPILLWIAAGIEAGIQNWPDMAILLGIQFLNASISFYETTKAGNAVAALKSSLKPTCYCKRDGKFKQIDAGELVPGDLVQLTSGYSVPADTRVNSGQIDVDQSALTGESLPVTMYKGDTAKMGSNVVKGETEGTVEKTGKNTFFGEAASMLSGDHEMSNMQKLLIHIMTVLVVMSISLSGSAFGYLLAKGEAVKEALSFTVVLIVASIPLAIEIVCTTTLALGSRQLSDKGAIVSRLTAIEDMAGLNVLCSDKTGTLTQNKMVIQEDTPTFLPDQTQATVVRYAAMAAKWREPPKDALDKLVLGVVDMDSLEDVEQIEYVPFDPTLKRTEATVRTKEEGQFKVTKGAPQIIFKLEKDSSIVAEAKSESERFGKRGIRCLAVAKTDKDDVWHLVGLLTFLDPPREDTKETIATAVKYGVRVKMITGDHLEIAKETARVLGMGMDIEDPAELPSLDENGKPPKDLVKKYGAHIDAADGFAQVFPSHKYLIVETLRRLGYKVGMTGDGVNDAPALKRADVGVAVSGATDAARAAAAIILTQEGLSTIVEGIVISREIFQRMKNFITYRIAATMQLLIFFFIAVLSFHPISYVPNPKPIGWKDSVAWPNFFHMPVLMLMLITLLNDGTLISIGYDIVKASPYPARWNLPVLFIVSGVLGMVACASSLLLLWAALDSWNPHGWFQAWNIGGLAYGHVTNIIYLKVSVSDFLTLFSARTHDGFFWSVKPAKILLGAAALALSLSTILSIAWPTSTLDSIPVQGLGRQMGHQLLFLWVWLYCLVWWIIQDAAKVLTYKILFKYNVFNIKEKIDTADNKDPEDIPLEEVQTHKSEQIGSQSENEKVTEKSDSGTTQGTQESGPRRSQDSGNHRSKRNGKTEKS